MSASKTSRSSKRWTPEANVELLLSIIRTYDVKINYAEIAVILGDVTAEAVKQQYNKLKRTRGGKGKTELDMSGKKFDMNWKNESDDDEDWQTSGVKAES